MPVRNVTNRGGNVIGRFPSLKMQRMIAFESLLERDFIYLLDYDANVTWFEEQPLTIEYQHEGKLRHYTPDFHLIEHDQHVLVECKPDHFVATADNQRKFAVAQAWCLACDWQFRIVTDAEVRAGYRLPQRQAADRLCAASASIRACAVNSTPSAKPTGRHAHPRPGPRPPSHEPRSGDGGHPAPGVSWCGRSATHVRPDHAQHRRGPPPRARPEEVA